ncbi:MULTISPECIES: HlyD family secretion protein [Bacteroidota]|jgi:membrane fusion protein (multidrug efflux system)|uniref:Membrane fusion protein, multidrug efflux system n=5 Tax=Weeksellaceae TaxID=2762318 RepID=A0A1W1YKM8_9FLAO|nr:MULTISPECIES: HlyD family secretion protein [Bacteroidota]MBP6661809.1 HlyD family secretion protein [Paludibacter sp.]AQX84265.1 hemolysin D [Elizabethkingia bruuniana]AZA90106.1 HlyD family secretion protein [Chryseobacterium nakagawai]EFK33899.1 auxiliary transport protein, membrane fusion protein (MFP) family protein [Chryseobacterium gleum ATCC 35910]KUY28444.1 hemolysin D [Elizabethkingia bruuniana]
MSENIENNNQENTPQPTGQSAEKQKVNKQKTKQKKTKIINILIVILVLGGLYFVVKSYFNVGNDKYTNAAQVESFINPINTRVSAYITEIRFVEHQYVKKGDTLLILDDREIQTQLGQAEATYMSALASKNATSSSVKTATNNVNTVGANVQAAKANIEATKARLWNAEQNFNRYKNLLADEAVTRQQFDQIKTDFEAQKAQLEAQISQYQSVINSKTTSELSVNEVQSRLGMNDADIKRTQSALDMAKLNLSYTVITAPHDGIMGRRTVNVGQLLNPSQQVGTIVDINNIWVTANYREKQMGNVQIGGLAKIQVDALGGKEFEGKITAVSGATGARYAAVPVDNSTGNFVKVQQRIPVRIEFTDKNKPEDLKLLRAGMNVEVNLK